MKNLNWKITWASFVIKAWVPEDRDGPTVQVNRDKGFNSIVYQKLRFKRHFENPT